MDSVRHLMRAVSQGDVHTARALLARGADPNGRAEDGGCPLLVAAMVGPVEVVRVLLDAGADANIEGPDGSTPLLNATLWRQVDVARLLLERGADIRHCDRRGWTALQIARSLDHPALVELLRQYAT